VPPDVVHGFRNDGDEELRFLNLHAPGVHFAEYLRAMRDGRAFAYDQHDPPADGGRAVSEASIGPPLPAIEGERVRAEPLVDAESIAIAAVSGEPAGVAHAHPTQAESFYVLDGELVLTAGQRELRGEPGAWLQVPPGLVHSVSAARPVRYLDIHTPGGGLETMLGGLGLG
jgi:quercetin dioxygenase-like cupin family protein